MAGERDGLGDVVADRLPRDERREQHRELRVAGAGERLGRRVEQEVGERLAERGLGLVDHAPRGMVAPRRAHPGLLRSLTGEHDRDAHTDDPSAVPIRHVPQWVTTTASAAGLQVPRR